MASAAASGMKMPAPFGARFPRSGVEPGTASPGPLKGGDRENICWKSRFINKGPIERMMIANLAA